MTIHVHISEVEGRIAELLAAAQRGEEVVVDRGGAPIARLLPIESEQERRDRIRADRMAAIGMWKHLIPEDVEIGPSMTDDELEERFRRKFGSSA